MEGHSTNFAFGAMDFSNLDFGADYAQNQSFQKPAAEGNTDAAFFFGDEGIDTNTTASFDQSFEAMNSLYTMPAETGFTMQQNLVSPPRPWASSSVPFSAVSALMYSAILIRANDRIRPWMKPWEDASTWNTQLPTTLNDFSTIPAQSFDTGFPAFNSNKRSLQVDTHDFPQSKRHASADFTTSSSFASPFIGACFCYRIKLGCRHPAHSVRLSRDRRPHGRGRRRMCHVVFEVRCFCPGKLLRSQKSKMRASSSGLLSHSSSTC